MSRVRAIVHWFRRDLRVADNTALFRAARDAERVVPVFVLDDHYAEDPDEHVGPARFRFLRESLEALAASLPRVGGRLVVRRGPAARALPELLAETGADAVYANSEIGPYPQRRDADAAAALEAAGARLRLFPDALLVEPDTLATGSGEPYTVYTPFSKKWLAAEKRDPEPEPASLDTPELPTIPLGRVRAWRDLGRDPKAPPGGEAAARALVDAFFAGPAGGLQGSPAARYGKDRDRPAIRGTSRLSPHLHFGSVSPRTLRAAAERAWSAGTGPERASLARFVLELGWREFYHHVLFHFPRVARESFREELDALAWRDDADALQAWKDGRTGYPLVDAGMRELRSAHWMHNRARMVTASFLTKDLHVHWRQGETWFEHALADADLANNNGGWQWAAGSGTDAAPYFRIFSPVLQSQKFDPKGEYIRRHVPELARVPEERIHEPWTMTEAEQSRAGCRIGVDYPPPIVDHARERRVALAMWDAVRG
ncbi:MAG TPA: deoxyribodipyrimidine photo-lyase [Thermoanaerobaculia bacterium]